MRRLDQNDMNKIIILSLMILCNLSCNTATMQKISRPNIVVLYIDDLGWKDLGCTGSKYYETPHIDKMAAEGMSFTQAYAGSPVCSPSRAALFSGQYSARNKMTEGPEPTSNADILKAKLDFKGKNLDALPTRSPARRLCLHPDQITFAEVLQQAGYKTGYLGKWHCGWDEPFWPDKQGFEMAEGFRSVPAGTRGHWGRDYIPYLKKKPMRELTEDEYMADALTQRAVEFIEENSRQPFLLVLSHYLVHTPLQGKPEKVAKWKKKATTDQDNPVMAAMIESVDQGIGKILNTLDKLDLSKNTIVVFYSDNGGHGPTTSMTPLRGSKGMLYEGGIRVPLIFHWKGKISPDLSCDIPVASIDFFPTFLEISGASIPEGHPVDGESLVPLFSQNGKIIRKEIFWHFPAYLENYRGMEGKWRTTPAGAIRKGEWKLIEFFEDGSLELYNLEDDLGEHNNLAENNPEIKNELYQLMLDWRKVIQAPVPEELNPEYEEEWEK